RFYDSASAFNAGTQSSRNVPVHYTYDAMGRMHTVTDDSGTTTNSYDVEGNLTAVNSPEGTISYAICL
ncbi:MAG: RHS repeat protein, partial [Planctomycetota bacterium]|nr:RHS repeat protein [Planctomycetota bacterium]